MPAACAKAICKAACRRARPVWAGFAHWAGGQRRAVCATHQHKSLMDMHQACGVPQPWRQGGFIEKKRGYAIKSLAGKTTLEPHWFFSRPTMKQSLLRWPTVLKAAVMSVSATK